MAAKSAQTEYIEASRVFIMMSDAVVTPAREFGRSMGVWGLCPQQGPGAELLERVRGQRSPEADDISISGYIFCIVKCLFLLISNQMK
jgi:hypothetical protein